MAIVSVVKWDGGYDAANKFAYKFPSDELGTWTQLIVNESQEAVLYKGGQALDIFGPGRHTLETANIPLLRNIVNIPFGGESPFKAEVWFVNKMHSLENKWGTPSPIQVRDPEFDLLVTVRSLGQFGIQIVDSKKFLVKLVGTMPLFDKISVTKNFKTGIIATTVKNTVASYLTEKNISVLDINNKLIELSEYLHGILVPKFDEYGIKLINFNVTDISIPADDPNFIAINEAKRDKATMRIRAQGKRAEMDTIGFNYMQERSFDVMEGAAVNPGGMSGNIMNAGMGMAMGMGMGGMMTQQTAAISQNIKKTCGKCNAAVETRFCPHCGNDTDKKEDMIDCSNCNAKFSKKYKFCPECGNIYKPCESCGADMPDDSTVCTACGKSAPKPCPKCNAEIKGNPKFCPECGESLKKKCGGCGVPIEGSPKFCPECGNAI